tara:strand:+ start:75 stop:293 length:219 start_codon:yes stop_codon:yes gene_type:complete
MNYDFSSLTDWLDVQHIAAVIDQYEDQLGPWPIKPYPGSTAFSRALYRYLDTRDKTDERYEEDRYADWCDSL